MSVSAETVVAGVPRRFAVGHPVATFLLVAVRLAGINLFIPLLAGWPLRGSTWVGALLGGLVGGAVRKQQGRSLTDRAVPAPAPPAPSATALGFAILDGRRF